MRTMQEIDAECIATARIFVAMAKLGVMETTLLPIQARIAALLWVLNPTGGEVQAQGAAWQMIAQVREEG